MGTTESREILDSEEEELNLRESTSETLQGAQDTAAAENNTDNAMTAEASDRALLEDEETRPDSPLLKEDAGDGGGDDGGPIATDADDGDTGGDDADAGGGGGGGWPTGTRPRANSTPSPATSGLLRSSSTPPLALGAAGLLAKGAKAKAAAARRPQRHSLVTTKSLANMMTASFRFVEDYTIHRNVGPNDAAGAAAAGGGAGHRQADHVASAGFGGGSSLRSGLAQVLTSFPFFVILSEVNASLFRRSARWRAVARAYTAAMYVLPPAVVFGAFGTPANPAAVTALVGAYLLVFLLPAAYPGIRALRKYRAAHHLVDGTFIYRPIRSIKMNYYNVTAILGYFVEFCTHAHFSVPMDYFGLVGSQAPPGGEDGGGQPSQPAAGAGAGAGAGTAGTAGGEAADAEPQQNIMAQIMHLYDQNFASIFWLAFVVVQLNVAILILRLTLSGAVAFYFKRMQLIWVPVEILLRNTFSDRMLWEPSALALLRPGPSFLRSCSACNVTAGTSSTS